MRKPISFKCAVMSALAFCLFLTCDLGQEPLGPVISGTTQTPVIDPSTNLPVFVDSITSNMRIFVNPSKILSNNTDRAEVSVLVYDDYHNPIENTEVIFWATHGIIEHSDSTDSAGEASVEFRSVPQNAEAWVYARANLRINGRDTTVTIGHSVTLYGLTVTAIPSLQNALVNQLIPVRIEVLDASGEPVGNTSVALSGAISATIMTRGDGTFDTAITSSIQSSVSLMASALGAADTTTVAFWITIPASAVQQASEIKELRVFSSRAQLRADNSDQAVITAILIDPNNNPVVGDTVTFKSNLGIIDAFAIVDSSGHASVTLRSSPVNDTCTVWAFAITEDGVDSASTRVTFSGVSLLLTADPLDLKTGQYAGVEALLTDASGNAIGGSNITFQVLGGSFQEGASPYTVALNPEGKAQIHVTSSSAGTVKVWASANKSTDSVSIAYTTNTLTLTSAANSIAADGVATTIITATYTNGSGQAVSGAAISFAANAGTILTSTVVTNASGQAQTTLRSADFATFAIVQANAPNGTAQDTVFFIATTAFAIALAVTPDNVGTNGGTATLIATVTDPTGNMVSGASVNFKIINGPGGNEYIAKPVVIAQNGIARSALIGGSIPSSYRGCEVAAYAGSAADTSKLTISGEPYVITVSRPEDDTIVVPDAGQRDESTFDFNIGAVVQDINGNPVADNTEVHFSAVVSGMAVCRLVLDYWSGINSADEIKAVLAYALVDVYFEDINNNVIMDPNIDLKLDFDDNVAQRGDDVNMDGTCDYNPAVNDFFYDFNGNGVCDVGVGEPFYIDEVGNEYPSVFADLNQNGYRDLTELYVDHNSNGICDLPASGDFRFSLWEMRPMWRGERLDFEQNDFAVVIDASAPTVDGVAFAHITYPRQFARRLTVNVNAEANGIRDKDGERFTLPQIK